MLIETNNSQDELNAEFQIREEDPELLKVGKGKKFTAEEWARRNEALATEDNERIGRGEEGEYNNFRREDFELHQKLISKKKEKHDEKRTEKESRLLYKIRNFIKNKKEEVLSESELAHEEALRDNRDWDRKYKLKPLVADFEDTGETFIDYNKELDKEYAEYQRMLKVVIDHLKQKRDNPDGEAKNRKFLILALGGGLKGPYGAGQVIALNELGFNDKFDVAVGISAGACDLGYMLAGDQSDDYKNTREGASIYNEECCDTEFLVTDPGYLMRHPGRIMKVMNVGVARDIMAGTRGHKKLNTDNIKNKHTKFYVMATRVGEKGSPDEKGVPELIDAKNNDAGIVESIHASMALPVVYGERVKIDGKNYLDGALTPLSLEEVIRKFQKEEGITDVLLLPQTPFKRMGELEDEAKYWEKLAPKVIPGSLNSATATLVRKFLQGIEGMRRDMEYVQKDTGVNIGVMFPDDDGLDVAVQDPERIKMAMANTARRTCEDFGEPEKYKNIHLL